ncbi:hypothetical protein M2152_001835 [Microbacteriaceae bacterium SG_E_30_P1]|uniref:DUF4350 domain-containing protein n=1 Tax=Antiquaquibacter oligotrophicus TaxID=2880260 RepID=A0ABT6KNS6_9MICO|nr:DUF4350 domain-containing protein [Antiquaquibacter oligotrophicus]MDH6181653.1 hypothetical protein [Antiquaquibacter oligotrophicus]UDF12663.1 DUF4350 domain-containing protein [Antiquaquibacter oligotrophicus]
MTAVLDETTEVTPTLRVTARRWVSWIAIGIVAIAVALVSFAAVGSGSGGPPLDPESPAPTGTMALVEVLRDQGVDVTVTRSLDDTIDAVRSADDTTLVLHDVSGILDGDQLINAASLTSSLVILDPYFSELRAIAPEVAHAGSVTGILDADCDLGAVERAGTITGDGVGFRVIDDTVEAERCFESDDDVFSVIRVEKADGDVTVVGATTAMTNEAIVNHGNAAFALGLLGERERLVWYVPSFSDIDVGESDADLSPAWVIAVMILLVIVGIAAAVWRGRRFGPLVIENLPVTVKASETMLGRSRLYARSSSRLRALDALRIGTIDRLATMCGLSRHATVEEVIAAVAAVTGGDIQDLRNLLVGAQPRNDRDLIAYSDALLTLERDVARRLSP